MKTEYSSLFAPPISQLGKIWKLSNLNPLNSVDKDLLIDWSKLIESWAENTELPLLVRKSKDRGSVYVHESGRNIILTDNSAAQWVFYNVLHNTVFSIDEIQKKLEQREIPMMFAISKAEKNNPYSCALGNFSINERWKLCHKNPVGLRVKDWIGLDIEVLKQSFVHYMNPLNHFVVPKEFGGIGEIKAFIDQQ